MARSSFFRRVEISQSQAKTGGGRRAQLVFVEFLRREQCVDLPLLLQIQFPAIFARAHQA